MADIYTAVLRLNDVHELFEEPVIDPFTGDGPFETGMETLIIDLEARPITDECAITIMLPREKITSTLQAETKQAIERYCNWKVERLQRTLDGLRRDGMRALVYGLAFVITSLVIAAVLAGLADAATAVWAERMYSILSDGFVIIGWVALWHPANVLLFEHWPHRHDMLTYKKIANAEVTILPK